MSCCDWPDCGGGCEDCSSWCESDGSRVFLCGDIEFTPEEETPMKERIKRAALAGLKAAVAYALTNKRFKAAMVGLVIAGWEGAKRAFA